jgi:hypothetical protein
VIRQQPGSADSEKAKKRIDQLRAKLGNAAVESAFAAEEAKKKAGARGGSPARSSTNGAGPLPPPETDLSLPPPASLNPDATTAPETSPTPGSSPASEASPAADVSASPEVAASPTP